MSFRTIGIALAAIALATSLPSAQNNQPAEAVQVVQLQHGHPFQGDVRDLPHGLPPQHEKMPKGEEPPLGPDHGSGDGATQGAPGSAPTPPPGSGGGAGNFAGLDFQNFGAGWPPDTNGDVGPTYFIQTVNTSVGIFRKSDGTRVTAFSFNTLMAQGNFGNACDNLNGGDPIVVYDSGADRWIISDFAFATSGGNPVAPYFECFAVSRTGDPVSGGWYFYSLQTNDLFPDYPKLGVWPDALYLTANMFSSSFKNVRVWALNKAQMYAGAAPTALMFNLASRVGNAAVFTAIPSTYHTATGVPPAGRPNLIASIWSAKVARVWKFHADFTTPANSTVTGPSNVSLASWTPGPTSVPAKNGNGLDSLYERLMVQNQYTNFGGTESLWLTHTVANPGNTTLPAPRWYQLNVSGGTVVTSGPVQQSTFAPDTSVGRWMPSLAVDKTGNMAIGYSASSSSLFPAVRYAGRLSTDPLNTLGQSETSLIEGTASQCCTFSDGSANNRWGDYSAMTLDPDGCTFWYTNEFYQSPQPTTLLADNWQTRIGSFKFANCTPNGATLQGTVTDSVTNAPVSGATVSAGSSSTATDATGQYTIGSLVAGTYTVNVSATGYNSTSASVTLISGVTTTQNFSLVAASGVGTSLAAAAASGTYGGTTTVSATLTAGGNGVSGKSVAFTLNGNPVGSALTNANGLAALSNVSLVGIGAGTYGSGVGASFAGDGTYSGSAGTNSLTISQASQTIAFGALPSKTYGDPNFAVSATASSGLVVSFAASGNCTVSGTTVSITGAGSCTITASQAGDANYLAAASVPQTFSIAKASQTIAFGALAAKTYGDPSFAVSATATSNLVVSFAASGNCTVAGTTVSITGAGSCTITASQAGDANYLAATSVPQTFSIAKASQTIAFGALPAKTYGDPSFGVSATASSGLVVSFAASGNCTIAGTTVSITGAGSCTITASQAGDANYLAATSVPQTFSIAKASQTIAFGALAAKTYGDPSFAVSATATSNLVVSFAASGNCTIAGTTVSITGAGSCTITASQAGDANYLAATSVPQTFSIAKANQIITFNALANKTTSDPPFAVTASASSGLAVAFAASGNCTVSGNTVTITGAGSCTITASQPGDVNFNAAVSVPQSFNISSSGGNGVPSPWASQDVGNVGAAGNATFSTGTFTVNGSGADIWDVADAFQYVHQTISGDGEIVARVVSQQNTNEWAKAGVIIREDLSAGARYAGLFITPSHGLAFQWRTQADNGSAYTGAAGVVPQWVKLVRIGSTITAYASNDGNAWTVVNALTLALNANVEVGLGVTSHASGVLSSVTFDNVSVTTSGSNTPPAVTLTSPGDQATFTAPATIDLAADASDADGVAKVEFYQGSQFIATVTAAPYSFSWTNVAAGQYVITAKAYDTLGAVTTSAAANITVQQPVSSLPTPWVAQDVGSTAVPGSSSFASGLFTVAGSGADIWNTADAFQYVYQPLAADGQIVARVGSQQNTDPWAKAGLMIRESTAAGSRYGAVLVTPSNGVVYQDRAQTNNVSAYAPVSGTTPIWLKLVRTGSVVSAFTSVDGTTWVGVGSADIGALGQVLVGLAVTSHHDGITSTATFDHVVTP